MKTTRCPRCETGVLRNWDELSDEEKMVARRLPGSRLYPLDIRIATHRWCPRCWFEATDSTEQTA